MHHDTPLGTIMHLRELDRQAAPNSVPFRSLSQRSSLLTTFGGVSAALLRRVRAFVAATRNASGHALSALPELGTLQASDRTPNPKSL
jgi:hypothetical protein